MGKGERLVKGCLESQGSGEGERARGAERGRSSGWGRGTGLTPLSREGGTQRSPLAPLALAGLLSLVAPASAAHR